MSGRRFGVGLAAGVFFAVAVIVVSGALASSSSPLYQSLGSTGSPNSAATTTSTIATTTGTVPGAALTASGNQTASVSQTNLNSLSSASTYGNNAQNSASSPRFSSELVTMNQLSTQARALLLAPVVAAFVIGALLYRVSRVRKGQEGD